MTAALVIACMLTEGEKEQRGLLHALSLGGRFTPGHFMCFLWSDSYPIMKRPVLQIQNAFETDLNKIAQTIMSGTHS